MYQDSICSTNNLASSIRYELNYSDIYLVPSRCTVDSRSQCDTYVELGGIGFLMPVYPSNMKSVVNEDTCVFLAKSGYFYTMHRFGIDQEKFVEKMRNLGLVESISIGVNDDSFQQLDNLKRKGLTPDYITVDVANCWSDKGRNMIKYIRSNLPSVFVIAGNVATREAVDDLIKWGAMAVKCGISGGKVCTTKNKTGFHRPMASTIYDCYKDSCDIPIIADGGIRDHGDIAKAIALGATMVMAGSLFAGYDQSAGDIVEINGRMYKEYYGSASEHNKGEYKNVEGKKELIEYKGDMKKLLIELQQDLQSSISYSGGNKLFDLRNSNIIGVK